MKQIMRVLTRRNVPELQNIEAFFRKQESLSWMEEVRGMVGLNVRVNLNKH